MNELLLGLIVISYLMGSIPFGLLLTRAAGLGDIRSIGSGNIGATNVLRTGNKKLAALTLFLDGLKGAGAVFIAHAFFPESIQYASYAAIAAFLGHLYPIWLKFRGGKGVATALGIFIALVWPVGLLVMVTWLATAKLFHYSSVAALVAFGLSPIYVALFGAYNLLALTVIIAILIFWKHRENITRLLKGTESQIGGKSNEASL